jgi:hypothetical protein
VEAGVLMLDYRSIGWWYWLATAGLLTAGVTGWPPGIPASIGLVVVQAVHFAARHRSVTAFPVQVRLAYLLVLLCFFPPAMRPLYWLPVTGTWALVLFGYCTTARALSLLPWNRTEPLSLGLLKRTFLSAPVSGSIMKGLPPSS